MAIATVELQETIAAWPKVSRIVSVLKTPEQYERAVAFLDELIDLTGGDENHPLASLMDTIGTLIEDYENNRIPEPMVEPIEVLKYLMAEHAVAQSDLPEIGGGKLVAQVLKGQRPLTVAQIKALAARFHVSPAVFL